MKKLAVVFFFLISIFGQSFANDTIAKTLLKEWKTFRTQVDTLEAQGDIGGYMFFKEYGKMTLLWRTSNESGDNEVIRFFMPRANGLDFAVTYHKSTVIVPGKVVLRRFVGTEPTGWINHTIDFNTGKFIGKQGDAATLSAEEKQMMKEWGIQNYE
jgi:hypothetical protein